MTFHILSPLTPTHLLILGPISHTNIPDLISDLAPPLTRPRHRPYPTKRIIHPTSHKKAAKEVQVVDISRAFRDGPTDGADESDDVDEYPADVGDVAAQGEAVGVYVGCVLAGTVEVLDYKVAFADDVVVAYYDASDGGEEDGVGG